MPPCRCTLWRAAVFGLPGTCLDVQFSMHEGGSTVIVRHGIHDLWAERRSPRIHIDKQSGMATWPTWRHPTCLVHVMAAQATAADANSTVLICRNISGRRSVRNTSRLRIARPSSHSVGGGSQSAHAEHSGENGKLVSSMQAQLPK